MILGKKKSINKKKISIFVGAFAVIFMLFASRFPRTNIAQTDISDSDARLHPRVYQMQSARVAQEIRALIPQLKTYGRAWKIVDASTRDAERIHVEVPVLFFTDDLMVTLSPQNGGASTRVQVRSASRVGKGDFGENRRHIIQFLTALDARFE